MEGILLVAGASSMSNLGIMILYVIAIIGFFYFISIRPQKKQQERHQAMVDSIEVGDYVVTTGGFYGMVIDISDDMVIVEFGSNKNCRIPMKKSSVAEIEKGEKNTGSTES